MPPRGQEHPPQVLADSYSSHRFPAFSCILDNPVLTIAGATYCLSFARLPWFNTMGAPVAIGMLVNIGRHVEDPDAHVRVQLYDDDPRGL